MWRLWVGIIFLILAAASCNVEYNALRKFYPDLTFSEYLILQDKLRITPNGD